MEQLCFNERFWKPVLGLFITLSIFHFSERQLKNSNVRPKFRTFGRDSECPAEIPNFGCPFVDRLLHFSFFPEIPVAHVLQFSN